MSDFYNPYNHIPPGDPAQVGKGALAQGRPAGHDRYHDDLWSGRIDIEIETTTPLLIPDVVPERDADGHKVYRTRRHGRIRIGNTDHDLPELPVASFKGPLRAAYEAITNSRFGVFRGHSAPLARRMQAMEGLGLVPVRIVGTGPSFRAELLTGTTRGWPRFNANAGAHGRWYAPNGPLYAAWLPCYGARTLSDASNFEHGELVDVRVQRLVHPNNFEFWEVVALKAPKDAWARDQLRAESNAYAPARDSNDNNIFAALRGYICSTNQSNENKHDERVFLSPDSVQSVPIEVRVRERWSQLIKDYHLRHRAAIEERRRRERHPPRCLPSAYLVAPPNGTDEPAYSRHVYEPGAETLKAGDLAYARLTRNPDGTAQLVNGLPKVESLFPVMIGRELGLVSPYEMLSPQLRPALTLDELSPADRVFGWVRDPQSNPPHSETDAKTKPEKPAAYKGQLRIRTIAFTECTDAEGRALPPIEEFGQDPNGRRELPLSILSTPKPAQARFYAARNKTGTPLADGTTLASAAYFDPRRAATPAGLRGRKVYPHHAHLASDRGYWVPGQALAETSTPRQPGRGQHHREYVRRVDNGRNQDNQNRSIVDWVRPGTRFAASIDVINLSSAELGALLWLLDLDRHAPGRPAHLRIGGGKPLGFGSVRVRTTRLALMTGQAKARCYSSLLGDQGAPRDAQGSIHAGDRDQAAQSATDIVVAYKNAIAASYGNGAFEAASFVNAFLVAARGYTNSKPMHYPRKDLAPDPTGKNYEWFVANERQGQNAGRKLALPLLSDEGEPALPWDPSKAAHK